MQSSKIVPSVLILISILSVPLLTNTLIQSHNTSVASPKALNYSLNYANKSVDLSVTSDLNSYLYIITKIKDTTIINKTTEFTTHSLFSFTYLDQSYIISVGLFTSSMQISDINYFIANKTINQPNIFLITHKLNQISNKILLEFNSSSQLNLKTSQVNSEANLQLLNSTSHQFLYQTAINSTVNLVSLEDIYNRTYVDTIDTTISSSNSTNSSINTFDFDYSYSITNNSVLFTINGTEPSTFLITLSNSTIKLFQKTKVDSYTTKFTFINLAYDTYNGNISATSKNGSLNKLFTISILDKTIPVMSTHTITTSSDSIQVNFTFSKPVKYNISLIKNNKVLEIINGTRFLDYGESNFMVSGGSYDISLVIIDKSNNINHYVLTKIQTTNITSETYFNIHTDKSIISASTDQFSIYPMLVVNGTQVTSNYTLTSEILINGILIQSMNYTLANQIIIPLNKVSLSLFSTSTFTLSCSIPLYNLTIVKNLLYYVPINSSFSSPFVSLQSYGSNFTSGEIITLHLTSSQAVHSNKIFIDVFFPELQYSLTFLPNVLNNSKLDFNFFVKIPSTDRQFLTLEAIIYYNSNYNKSTAYLRLQLTYGLDTINPTLLSGIKTYQDNSTVFLQINASDPIQLEIYYGLTQTLFSSIHIGAQFQSYYRLNLSSFMIQNANNIYYFKLIDSNGLTTLCTNASNYFSVFIPKIDFIAPWNTSSILINQTGHLNFSTNEDVTVSVYCIDTSYVMSQFVCGITNNYAKIFSLQLSFPIPNVSYYIQKLILTDRAGNQDIINLQLVYRA